ncbi:MAG: helix-turn-helix transcriptional regulator, partial [Methylocella sp.]
MSETQKKRTAAPYREFGALLARLRQSAGIAQQSELAALVDTTQQSISRWEAGLSRPRVKQIPRLAAALNAKADELLLAAGYGASTDGASSP